MPVDPTNPAATPNPDPRAPREITEVIGHHPGSACCPGPAVTKRTRPPLTETTAICEVPRTVRAKAISEPSGDQAGSESRWQGPPPAVSRRAPAPSPRLLERA